MKQISWCFMLLISCFGCEPSVLLPDPIDPRLPKFTTDGNNVAGALLNDDVWISDVKNDFYGMTDLPRFLIFEELDSAVMIFEGRLQTADRHLSIIFMFSDFTLKPGQLDSWEGKTIEIDGKNTFARVEGLYGNNCDLTGQIIFVRMDDNSNGDKLELGFSGTFFLESVSPCAYPFTATYGRFDYRKLAE